MQSDYYDYENAIREDYSRDEWYEQYYKGAEVKDWDNISDEDEEYMSGYDEDDEREDLGWDGGTEE